MESIRAKDYIEILTDKGSFKPLTDDCELFDPLQWNFISNYRDKVQDARLSNGLPCGILWGRCGIEKQQAIIIVNEFNFIGGSLATTETDAIVKAFETGISSNLPVIWCASSGGCRFFEGVFALHCIPRIIHARNALAKAHLPLITVSLNPLFGGTNICSTLADINIGEKGAHIGFAGSNMIKTIEKFPLPSDFQTSEYAFTHGHLDEVTQLKSMKQKLGKILRICNNNGCEVPLCSDFEPKAQCSAVDSWHAVRTSRSNRFKIDKIIDNVFEDFYELHGDRIGGDDSAIIAGLARIGSQSFALLGSNNNVASEMGLNLSHFLSSSHPSGHRKALRTLRIAERLRIPLVTFVDTPGAHPDVKSEAEGQPASIGELISAMLETPVPTIGFIIGEGGSAGALPFTVVDKLVMADLATYSVTSPEAVAAILNRDSSRAQLAAQALKLTSKDMLDFGVIDFILETDDQENIFGSIKNIILFCLKNIKNDKPDLTRRLRTH